MSLITLTTDFGDFYPATVKAALKGEIPEGRIIDITHSIPQSAVREGAFVLYSIVSYFPAKTVHLGVVESGSESGKSCRPIAVAAGRKGEKQFFVGPDNGLLLPAARRLGNVNVFEIRDLNLSHEPESPENVCDSEVFTHAGKHLAAGLPIEKLGPEVSDFTALNFGNFEVNGSALSGEALLADSFGNIITNIPEEVVLDLCCFGSKVEVNGWKLPFVQTYDLVRQGKPLALIGMHGFLELAVNRGNAESQLGIKRGGPVEVRVL